MSFPEIPKGADTLPQTPVTPEQKEDNEQEKTKEVAQQPEAKGLLDRFKEGAVNMLDAVSKKFEYPPRPEKNIDERAREMYSKKVPGGDFERANVYAKDEYRREAEGKYNKELKEWEDGKGTLRQLGEMFSGQTDVQKQAKENDENWRRGAYGFQQR